MDTDAPTTSDSKILKKSKRSGKQSKVEEKNVEDDDDIVIEEDDSMAAMQAMLGFGGFGTTKQKKIAGNDVYAVRKEKKTEYRQYMNRVGGFNRPLSPSRE
jgi:U4/U6.U5 tri-snRNP-associated protein 3